MKNKGEGDKKIFSSFLGVIGEKYEDSDTILTIITLSISCFNDMQVLDTISTFHISYKKKDCFIAYKLVSVGLVLIGNVVAWKIVCIGVIKIRMQVAGLLGL